MEGQNIPSDREGPLQDIKYQVIHYGKQILLILQLYHEATLTNLLEIILYHRTACENSQDSLLELIDFCYRKFLSLTNWAEKNENRIKEDDASVPYADGDWLYWWAFETGGQYRNWYR